MVLHRLLYFSKDQRAKLSLAPFANERWLNKYQKVTFCSLVAFLSCFPRHLSVSLLSSLVLSSPVFSPVSSSLVIRLLLLARLSYLLFLCASSFSSPPLCSSFLFLPSPSLLLPCLRFSSSVLIFLFWSLSHICFSRPLSSLILSSALLLSFSWVKGGRPPLPIGNDMRTLS